MWPAEAPPPSSEPVVCGMRSDLSPFRLPTTLSEACHAGRPRQAQPLRK